MDWDRLRYFHAVAMAGSFTAAARKHNVAQSSISRQILALEEQLKVSLFTRRSRGLVLTSEGEELLRTVEKVLAEIGEVEQRLRESREMPAGPLRVATTVSFGSMWLAGHLKDFLKAYPDIEMQLLLSDDEVDLSKGEADVAIRFRPSEQADLIQRQIMPVEMHIYASEDYLKVRGEPVALSDLDRHDLIVYGHDVALPVRDMNWILKAGASGKRRPILEINNVYGVVQAVESGLGIAAFPDYLAGRGKGLRQILTDVAKSQFHAYFMYPRERRGSKRIAAFRDYLIRTVTNAANEFVTE